MTYVPRHLVTKKIANKFEAIKVAALEARRLNERARMLGINLPGKITSLAIGRLLDGKVHYHDEKEKERAAEAEQTDESEAEPEVESVQEGD